jgi:glycine dehydrogenase subunit 1
MGRRGLRELAERNVELAHRALEVLGAANIEARFTGPFFNEFVVKIPRVARVLKAAEARGVLAGLPMTTEYPELDDTMLISVTEMSRASDIARLGEVMAAAVREQ